MSRENDLLSVSYSIIVDVSTHRTLTDSVMSCLRTKAPSVCSVQNQNDNENQKQSLKSTSNCEHDSIALVPNIRSNHSNRLLVSPNEARVESA